MRRMKSKDLKMGVIKMNIIWAPINMSPSAAHPNHFYWQVWFSFVPWEYATEIYKHQVCQSVICQTSVFPLSTPHHLKKNNNKNLPLLYFLSERPWVHCRAAAASCVRTSWKQSIQDPLPSGTWEAHLETSILGEMRHRAMAWETENLDSRLRCPYILLIRCFCSMV